MLLAWQVVEVVEVEMAAQPLSHNMAREERALDAKPVKMCAFLAASGSCGR